MRRSRSQRSSSSKRDARARTNEHIQAYEVRVIDEDGTQLGIMRPRQALEIAKEKGLDLVEVAPNAKPPVCRILNYGKYQYEQERKAKQARKSQKRIEIKEIRLKQNMAPHDISYRIRHAEQFLKQGNKVRVTVSFFRRHGQIVHPDLGRQLLMQFAESLEDAAEIEQAPKMEGRQLSLQLTPKSDVSLSS